MTRILTLLMLMATVCLPLGARTALEVFADAGADKVVGLLDRNTRLDMVDYFSGGMTHVSNNRFGGPAIIMSADSASVRFSPGESIECQLALSVSGRDTTVIFIETLQLPQPDSRVSVYGLPEWSELNAGVYAPEPVLSDWLTEDGARNRDEVERLLPFVTARADYDPATATLTYTNTLDTYFADKADLDRVRKWVRKTLSAPRKGLKFKVR